jgi:hypothetical protein
VGHFTEEDKSYIEDHKAPAYNASMIDGVRNPFSPKESTAGKNNQKNLNVTVNQTIAFPNRGQPRFSSGSEGEEDNGNVSHQTPENRSIGNDEMLTIVSRAPDLKVLSNRRASNNM